VRCGEGVPFSPRERGLGGAVKFISILDLKMASFGALWYAGGDASPIPLDPPLGLDL